jgi:hypothetical protein
VILGAFDPHPYGCPLSLRVSPSEMAEAVVAVCIQLGDLLYPSIYVINPSKGQSYPVLFLYGDRDDPTPRLTLFPGWEDNRRSPNRRLDYARQTTLLQRIHDAGLPGESLESYRGNDADRLPPGVLVLPLAASVPEVDGMIVDLYERLGDILRITVTHVPQLKGRPPLPVVRCYAPNGESHPRILWVPGWATTGERDPLDMSRMDRLVARLAGLPEIPAEASSAL